jgi:hypothetical protein
MPVRKPARKVGKYERSGELIRVYLSAKVAAERTGIHLKSIQGALRKERKTAGGFVWSYED